jgi:hypothetical protein
MQHLLGVAIFSPGHLRNFKSPEIVQVLDKTGIRYRYNESFKVSRTYITTYAGGSVVEGFAPRQDQYIWFDEFESGSGDGSSCEGSFPPDAPVAPPASAPAVDEESQTAPSGVILRLP